MSATRQFNTMAAWAGIVTIMIAFSASAAAQDDNGMQEVKDQATGVQQASPTQTSSRSRRRPTEEITVTVRKLEENLKDVPLSITAFDANMIEAAGITNLQDIADLTPGLTFFNPFGEDLPVPIIRGIAQTNIFGETNAAIFVDGVFVAARDGLNFSQLDVERIEVVKGPQSALYGRTAFAGVINYITKRPADELEVKVDVEAGNNNKQKGSLLISGPLIGDSFRGRAAMLYDDWDGSYKSSEAPDNNIGGRRFRSFQGSLVWDVLDNLEVYGSVYSSNDKIDDPAIMGLAANCENMIDDTPEIIRYQNFCGQIPDLDQVPSPGPGLVDDNSIPVIAEATGANRELFRANFKVTWDFDFGSFVSLTGYSQTEQSSETDFGQIGYNSPLLYCEGASGGDRGQPDSCLGNPANQRFFIGVLNSNNGTESDEFSQELRFTSAQDQRFRYTAGGYYYKSASHGHSGSIIHVGEQPNGGVGIGYPPIVPGTGLNIGTSIFYCGFTDDGCEDPFDRETGANETKAWAVFTGVDFDFTDRLTGRGQLRYGEQEEQIDTFRYARCGDVLTPPAPLAIEIANNCGDDVFDLNRFDPLVTDPDDLGRTSNSGSADFSSVTGRLGLDYKINDVWLVYGSVATGDKPGGLQLVTPTVFNADGSSERVLIPHTFDTEKLTAYEIGLKGGTEDGRLRLDMALFYNDWRDIVLRQITTTLPGDGRQLEQSASFNVNAGTAEVFGWEMTADVGITDDLSGRVAVNWNDSVMKNARQDTFENFPSFAPDGDVSGNKLLRQPEWTVSASLNYVRSLWGSWEGFGRIDGSYQDKIYLGNDNQNWLPSRTTANLRFGAESGRITLAFWVRNMFNEDSAIAAFRDIWWSNTDSITPPFTDLGSRPDFNQFPPFRMSVTYPTLRTFGLTASVRFGSAAQ